MGDDFVVLESDDGYCFSVPRHIATSSSTLKAMLDEEGAFLLLSPLHSVHPHEQAERATRLPQPS